MYAGKRMRTVAGRCPSPYGVSAETARKKELSEWERSRWAREKKSHRTEKRFWKNSEVIRYIKYTETYATLVDTGKSTFCVLDKGTNKR